MTSIQQIRTFFHVPTEYAQSAYGLWGGIAAYLYGRRRLTAYLQPDPPYEEVPYALATLTLPFGVFTGLFAHRHLGDNLLCVVLPALWFLYESRPQAPVITVNED